MPGGAGKVGYVIHVPKSDAAPHAVAVTEVPAFYERTHSGNQPMSWERIQDSFARNEERATRIRLLIHEVTENMRVANGHAAKTYARVGFDVTPYETEPLRRIIQDLYPLMASNQNLMNALSRFLRCAAHANNVLQAAVNSLPPATSPYKTTAAKNKAEWEESRQAWQERLKLEASDLWTAANHLLQHLGAHFKITVPNYPAHI